MGIRLCSAISTPGLGCPHPVKNAPAARSTVLSGPAGTRSSRQVKTADPGASIGRTVIRSHRSIACITLSIR